MATYGPSYTSVVYIGSSQYRRYRGYLYCTTSESNTTVTISYTAKVQMADAAQYGVKIAVSGGNSATGYLTSSSSSFKDVCTATGTLSVTKGTSATTKTVTATASGTTVSGYGSAGGSANVSISIPIPAKPSYTVSFNANGGSGAPSSQTKWYGTTLTLSSTVPKRTGYNFLGWSTSSTATTATYKAGGSYTSNSAATLYAVWELAYVSPVISNLAAVRCDEVGNVTAIGKFAKVSFDWAVDPALALASGTVTCSSFSKDLGAVEAASGTATEILGGDLDPLSAYSITATVKDSAGLSSTGKTTLAAEEYSLPMISGVVAVRTDSDGNYDEEGTAGSVSFNWSIDEMDGTNTVTNVAISYREKESEGDYVDLETTFAGTKSGTASAVIAGEALDVSKSYDVKMVVADQVSSTARTTVITRSFFTMDMLSGGRGVAFGKASDKEGLEIEMDVYLNKKTVVANQQTIYGTDADGNEVAVLTPRDENGDLTLGLGGYSVSSGGTSVYGKEVRVYSQGAIGITSPAAGLTNREYGVNKVLWSGTWYGGYNGNAGNATLQEAISAQPHGIVLVFCEYSGSAAQDSGWSYFFVPKQHVSPTRAGGVNFATHHYGNSSIMSKYLYIQDTVINGWTSNNSAANNSSFVLRYVIGV